MARKSANYSCGSINGPSSRSNYIKGCRCNQCTAAHRQYMAEYMARKRSQSGALVKNKKKTNRKSNSNQSVPVETLEPPKSLKELFSRSLNKK